MTDLGSTLLIIPCRKSKRGANVGKLANVQISPLLSDKTQELLSDGREMAWELPSTNLDMSSEMKPALAYYSGQPYKTEGFRELLIESMNGGLHVLVISGGYGVLRVEEPIHNYEANLQNTLKIWRNRIHRY